MIEKRTFARVISEGIEEADPPVQTESLLPMASAKALSFAPGTEQRKKRTKQAALVLAALLLVGATAVFVYLKVPRQHPAPASRAKNTLIRLTSNNASDGFPVWSPDGKRIAFASPSLEKINGGLPRQIYVVDADGSNITMLTRNPPNAGEPCWSPEGARVAFVMAVDKLGARINIFQVDSDGGNLKRLTSGPAQDRRPCLSPDGSKLAFQSNRDGNYEIYVMNLSTN